MILGFPAEFYFFVIILLCVALFHNHVLKIALTGLVIVSLYKIGFSSFKTGFGVDGFTNHLIHEWVIITNLLLLLVGFALLSNHFEKSNVTEVLSSILPKGWQGAFTLLAIIFFLSTFLDNIAAAIIGATIASKLFKKKVHIGYLAAIVAVANAGGAGSVLGDTTTTMMWLAGIPPIKVLPAFIGSIVALLFVGYFSAKQQNAYQPLISNVESKHGLDWSRVFIVFIILVSAVLTNILVNLKFNHLADFFPFIGASVWVALFLLVPLRTPDWSLIPAAFKGSIFLLALVLTASMMPVDKLLPASLFSTFGLGFLSSVFDNIPLTTLAIKQDNYDWGVLAYAVGYGGSMIWFGSSAGVAVSNLFPEAKSVKRWLISGWHIPLSYILGYVAIVLIWGWHPIPITN
ncbi:MAG: citrate transporter [Pelagibacteraceae bacterium]|nr:citrate transporter [Pelagibacteraceae bacterium]PHX88730.1 MAG: citrate transporter [Pelagibacteraceae bacterium]